MDKAWITTVAKQNAAKHELEAELILAFIKQESNFDTLAHRFEPNWRYSFSPDQQKVFAAANNLSHETESIDESMSYGCLQIMGSVARELGFTGNLAQLYDPEFGIHYGCLKLKLELKKHPVLSDAISSYNQGSPRRDLNGYLNQKYVDNVLANYREFKTKGI